MYSQHARACVHVRCSLLASPSVHSEVAAEAQRWPSARASAAVALAFDAAGSAARMHTVGSIDAHGCICYDACVLIAVRIKPEILPSLYSAE